MYFNHELYIAFGKAVGKKKTRSAFYPLNNGHLDSPLILAGGVSRHLNASGEGILMSIYCSFSL
jgi:hypothetical protein